MTATSERSFRPGVVDPETTGRRRSRLALSTLLVGAGSLHFAVPDAYARIVPRFAGDARTVVFVSGAVEVACGLLLLGRRTRRAGAWASAALFVAVFPANVQMALDGGAPGATGMLGSGVLAWLRLPLQVPLVVWALHHARRPGPVLGRSRRSAS